MRNRSSRARHRLPIGAPSVRPTWKASWARTIAWACHIVVVCVTAGCAASTVREGPRFDLIVLGTAQDGGRPHLGCAEQCCEWARALRETDTPACLGIHDRASGALVLIEATPAIESQVATFQRAFASVRGGRRPVDALLLTHAHVGHYLGLAQLGREVAAADALPVYVTPSFASYLRSNGPWKQLVELEQVKLHEIETGHSFEPIPGLSVEAIVVPHRDEFSDTVAYRMRGSERCVLFVPDIDGWDRHPELLERLLDGVDVAYVDGTFYDGRELPGRDLSEIPHPPIVDTMRRLAEHARAKPGSVRFIHMNHSNPLWLDRDLQRDLAGRGFAIATVGEREAL